MSKKCDKCHATSKTLRLCSRCKEVMYCSAKCQKEDWPEHKKSCSLIATKTSSFKDEVVEIIKKISENNDFKIYATGLCKEWDTKTTIMVCNLKKIEGIIVGSFRKLDREKTGENKKENTYDYILECEKDGCDKVFRVRTNIVDNDFATKCQEEVRKLHLCSHLSFMETGTDKLLLGC